jgi:hypothetical protein
MTTVGNAHTDTLKGGSVANPHTDRNTESESVDDPTTDNNGDVSVALTGVTVIDSSDNVVGVSITGGYRAQVQGVSGNSVTVRVDEPDGAGGFAAVTGTTINGETLSVTAHE